MVVMLSPAIGPLIGGVFADITWRLLFVVSVVGASFATVLTMRYMPRTSGTGTRPARLDWIGWIAAATGFPLILAGFTKASDWGLFAPSSLTVLGIGGSAIAFFVWWELRRDVPLIQLRMLEETTFRHTIILEWFVGIPYHVQLVAVPISVSTIAGRSPLQAGILITPAAIGTIAVMRPTSRVMLTRGPRFPVVLGAVLLLAATVILTATGAKGPTAVLVMGMVSLGMGAGLSMMPITAAGLDAVEPALVPQASAMRLLTKMLAQAIGVAIALSLIAWKLGANDVVAAATNDPLRAEAAFQWLGMLLLVPAARPCGWPPACPPRHRSSTSSRLVRLSRSRRTRHGDHAARASTPGARTRWYAVSVTPFDHGGRVDEDALRAHLRRLADPGLGVYVGGGGSGEGHSLSAAEHRQVLEIAVDEVGHRVPVRAMGVGPRHASEAIEFVSMAGRTGVEAIQIYSPELSHGHTLGPDELHRFLDDVLASTGAPCVLSTHRSVGYALPLDLIDDLTLGHRHVIGVNCTQDTGYLSGLISRMGKRIDVHLGGEAGAIGAIQLGAAGFLSSAANLAPRLVSRVARSLERGGDVATMLEGYGELLQLTALLRGRAGSRR